MKRTKNQLPEPEQTEYPEFDFEVDKSIDTDNLPGEILNMPNLIERYSTAIDDAEDNLSQSQLNADIDDADLENQVRKDPRAFGIEKDKPTEGAIKTAMRLTKAWKKSELKKINAIDQLNHAKTAMKAIWTKKHSLDQLLSGGKMNWFSMPDEPDDLEEATKKHKAKKLGELHYRQKQHMEKVKQQRNK